MGKAGKTVVGRWAELRSYEMWRIQGQEDGGKRKTLTVLHYKTENGLLLGKSCTQS